MFFKNSKFLFITLVLLVLVFFFWNFFNKKESIQDKELKEKIGQMLLVGFRGTDLIKEPYIKNIIKEVGVGGVMLADYDVPSKSYPRNIINPEQTKKLIEDLQNSSKIPLFITVDLEGGKVNRLKGKYGFIDFPSAKEMGQKTILETQKIAENIGKELFDLGFNTNFAPVVDVDINSENPVIGELGRSFSSYTQKVTNSAKAFIEGLHKYNIISTIKHFPGHGSSTEDSHLGLVDVTNTYREEELKPYEELIKSRVVDMVMTAHIINRNIDKNLPATLSSKFIQDILRKKLGFEGVVVSDDMHMGAIMKNYGFEEAIIKAINAGCNLLIISNNGEKYDENAPHKAKDIIFKAVKDRRISLETINISANKIYQLKKKFGIINQ